MAKVNFNFRGLLGQAHDNPVDALGDTTAIAARLKAILDHLREDALNPEYRRDLAVMVLGSLDLVETLSSEAYNIDEVMQSVAALHGSLSTILYHCSTSRPCTPVWGIVRDNGHILPFGIASSKMEVEERLAAIGIPDGKVEQLELTQRYMPRPSDVGVQPRPLAPPPITAEKSLEDRIAEVRSSSPLPGAGATQDPRNPLSVSPDTRLPNIISREKK